MIEGVGVGFKSLSPCLSRPYPLCLMKGYIYVNGQTLIVPLNNHNIQDLFYFVSIFLSEHFSRCNITRIVFFL